jgi:hypothetical protein
MFPDVQHVVLLGMSRSHGIFNPFATTSQIISRYGNTLIDQPRVQCQPRLTSLLYLNYNVGQSL